MQTQVRRIYSGVQNKWGGGGAATNPGEPIAKQIPPDSLEMKC